MTDGKALRHNSGKTRHDLVPAYAQEQYARVLTKGAEKAGVEVFVDDRFENFVELNRAAVCCYLMDAAHNRRYDVGHKRIKSLDELVA